MKLEKAIFACGCFWGAQHQFERAKGVIRSEVGYIGGDKENPTYQEVKAHTTGHAEATLVEFDAEETTYTDLCKLFFEIHDPAQTDGQGPDIGPNTEARFSTLMKHRSNRLKPLSPCCGKKDMK